MSLENRTVFHEGPLRDPKVGVWCGIGDGQIIDLIFM
jgi:hypothetical protein